MERVIRALILGILGLIIMVIVTMNNIISDPLEWFSDMPLWFWPLGLFMFLGPVFTGKE